MPKLFRDDMYRLNKLVLTIQATLAINSMIRRVQILIFIYCKNGYTLKVMLAMMRFWLLE